MSCYFQLCKSISREDALVLDRSRFKANIKYDGERSQIIKDGKDIFLNNRNGNIINAQFPEIVAEFSKYDFDFIIDGEIISFNDDFQRLQKRTHLKDKNKIEEQRNENPVKFVLFDVLYFKKSDKIFLMDMPLYERIKHFDLFDTSFYCEKAEYGEIDTILKRAEQELREGIVIKDMTSKYTAKRENWFKLKFFKTRTLMTLQYVENPKGIRVNDKDGNAVQVAGRNGIIVKDEIDKNGFCNIAVQYLEETKDGRLRQPTFKEIVPADTNSQ